MGAFAAGRDRKTGSVQVGNKLSNFSRHRWDDDASLPACCANRFSIKRAVTNRDRHAILAEAERGEGSAVAAYKDAMEKDLPALIKDIVTRQSAEVKTAHDKIRSLRDSAAQK